MLSTDVVRRSGSSYGFCSVAALDAHVSLNLRSPTIQNQTTGHTNKAYDLQQQLQPQQKQQPHKARF